MAKQTFTTGQVLTAAQMNSLQSNDFNQTVSAKTASYVLAVGDRGTRIEFNTSGSVTCTVNTGIFDAGDTLIVQNRGAGAVTVTAGTATVNTAGSLVVNQYESGTLYFVSASAALWFGSNPGDITGITTGASSGLTGGATSGTADLKLNFTAKGQLVAGTGSGTADFLTVGANGTTLVADSSTATGLKWAAAAAGGKVLQVVAATYNTAVTNSTSTYEDTGLTATITPSSASSKVLVLIHQAGCHKSNAANNSAVAIRAFRDATGIGTISADGGYTNSTLQLDFGTVSASILDTPATTSATTYKTQFKSGTALATATVQFSTAMSSIVLMEIGA